jgi:hypothetical protein
LDEAGGGWDARGDRASCSEEKGESAVWMLAHHLQTPGKFLSRYFAQWLTHKLLLFR